MKTDKQRKEHQKKIDIAIEMARKAIEETPKTVGKVVELVTEIKHKEDE